ncbi:MAG: nucleotide sugar dehydrogenase, partial [Sphingobacteriia bacterium]|nr:nucleotide sugar dehydrogenase [Sphingobacteriia bacterium]
MDKHLAYLTDPDTPIAIIGLGYVGLPLAVEFAKHRPVVGFDVNQARIAELKAGRDSTRETSPEDLATARHLTYTSDLGALCRCRIFIVTVPTPVDDYKRPDLTPLIKASETVGKVLKPGDLVIYESTVYPGCTEEDCVPVLARASGLTYLHTDRRTRAPETPPNPDRRASAPAVGRMSASEIRPDEAPEKAPTPPEDNGFYCGYSPERINPGDQEPRLTTIKKVTSGSTPEIAAIVDALYN